MFYDSLESRADSEVADLQMQVDLLKEKEEARAQEILDLKHSVTELTGQLGGTDKRPRKCATWKLRSRRRKCSAS